MASSVLSTAAAPALDFSVRLDPALLPERMDEPCSLEEMRGCLRDIAAVSRLTGAYRPTLRFLQSVPGLRTGTAHIVDVGCGGGDTLRRIAGWAARRKVALRLTGIDLNPLTTQTARELSGAGPQGRSPAQVSPTWITGDVFTHPAVQDPDLVLSSLVTHHMRDAEIVQFLRWMEKQARLGWFISDLARSPRAYRLFRIVSRVLRWHPFVQNDGLVSIRRAFREADWQRLLAAAGIPLSAVRIQRCALGRLCVSRVRQGGPHGF